MERKEILEKLKTTEAEIQMKIEQAEHKRNEILTHAQKQARKLEEDHEQQMKKERDAMVFVARKQIEEDRHRVLQKATIEADQLKKSAQIKKAQELFIRKFKESVHV
jgi:vacuolar-type H+-ATPase subunit H